MNNTNLKIVDFDLFYDTIKALFKMSEGIKMTVNNIGYNVCAKNDYSKCELNSNAVTSENEISFCIEKLSILIKILDSLKKIYTNDFSNVKMSFDGSFIRFSSPKFKTKINTVKEERILNFIGVKPHTKITSALTFKTNSDVIKSINGHSFLFSDASSPRIYITTNEDDMLNNAVFARVGCEDNDLENSVTMELGLIISGSLNDRKIILNFERLNVLNMVPSNDITVEIANELPIVWSKVHKDGKNGAFFNLDIYAFSMVR